MKKMLCALVLACVIMGGAFAQQKPAAAPAAEEAPAEAKEAKNSIAMDVFPLFKGIVASNEDFACVDFSFAYERYIANHFSIGPNLDMYFMKIDDMDGICFYFSMTAEGRYYPMANFERFFVGTTFGFNVLAVDGETEAEKGGFAGLTVSLKSGYKIVTSKKFYLEPSLSYVLSKSSFIADLLGGLGGFSFPSFPTPQGWQGGLRVGVTL